MTQYVLNRNYDHRSTHGHILNFKKGEPTYVPPVCEKEILMIGGEPVDGERLDILDDLPEPAEALNADDRVKSLMVAFELLEARNQRGDFTGQGRPHPKALKEICGFDVEVRERDSAWEIYLAKKAEK